MKASNKPPVFEKLFRDRYDEATGTLANSVVNSDQLVEAIQACGVDLGTGNPANFLKDFLRPKSCNANWPDFIKSKRFSAQQIYGKAREKLVFEFVPYDQGQTVPFPDIFSTAAIEEVHLVELVSLPSAARAMGRKDEAWLIQACVHQRIIETHFALHSPLEVVDVFHLQNSVKGKPEIDALFLLSYKAEGTITKALVTFEAKRNELILPNQIKLQITKIGSDCANIKDLNDIQTVVGMACKSFTWNEKRTICLFELAPIAVAVAAKLHAEKRHGDLDIREASKAAYIFEPEIKGI